MSNNHVKNMGEYWNGRFQSESFIWGKEPSKTATHALDLFKNESINSILVPGSGYGRNTKLFSTNGYNVTGIEISNKAYDLSLNFDNKTKFLKGNVMDIPYDNTLYDAIYCFNVLHLFRIMDRRKLIEKCKNKIKEDGFLFFVVFSDKEKSYGHGEEVEKNTFESKPGRPVHYYTEKDLIKEFNNFKLMETGIIKDQENHGKVGFHKHNLRYIFVKKTA